MTPLFSLVALLASNPARGNDTPPALPREFRAAWVATVANIDWPSKKGLSTEEQKKELLALLDHAAKLRLNAVILQVRPMCDALYDSRLEPWSEYLTGQAGRAPAPLYDPLAFAIEQAHARGLELHAWFNPYRARHPSATSKLPPDHLVVRRPDLAPAYGKHHWLNPTHPEVQAHSLAVLLDVVARYDVDGIHMDDYFYPYKEKGPDGKLLPFPDEDTWKTYQKKGGTLARDDWRRAAVDQFVAELYRAVKKRKPWVKVGISPFGIWRPGHPPSITGFDQYSELYADARKWFREGHVDYFTPQLYWPIAQEKQSYPKLLAWWAGENRKGRHLWPGNYTSRVTGKEKGWPANEIVEQITRTRAQKGATGNVHFSMKALLHNTGGIADALARVYREPALVPASTWLDEKAPARPRLTRRTDGHSGTVHIKAGPGVVRLFAVHRKDATGWNLTIVPAVRGEGVLRWDRPPQRIVVRAIGRTGLESEAVELTFP